MEISAKTISALGSIITGDRNLSPYRKGYELVEFFNKFGAEDVYEQGFPPRWVYAENKLNEFNNSSIIEDIIVAAFDLRDYLDPCYDVQVAVEYLNNFLEYDGYQLKIIGKQCKVYQLNQTKIDFSNPYTNSTEVTHIFINEQIEKCECKLNDNDFDGAITNARSLTEAVLSSIEKELDTNPPEYDGNLPKLYKRVQKLLNLCPGQEGLEDCLKQILSGFVSVVSGLATLRNTLSDAHVRSYKPSAHHARLAVNSAKTICNFFLETKEYQVNKIR